MTEPFGIFRAYAAWLTAVVVILAIYGFERFRRVQSLYECLARKARLNPLPPGLVIGQVVFSRHCLQRLIGHVGRRLDGDPADHSTREFRVSDEIACTQPRLGGERSALRQLGLETASHAAQCFYAGPVLTACVSAGQPDAAPQVSLPRFGECGDDGRNRSHIGPFDKPQAAT